MLKDEKEIGDIYSLRKLAIGYAIGMGSILIPIAIIISIFVIIFGKDDDYFILAMIPIMPFILLLHGLIFSSLAFFGLYLMRKFKR